MMWLPLSVTKPSRQNRLSAGLDHLPARRTSAPSESPRSATGNCRASATSFVSSTMQTKRRDAAGEDLLARERAAAALDQMQVLRGLVGAVDVQIEVARRELRSTARIPTSRQAPRGSLGARDDGAELRRKRLQALDEDVDGAARADAERDAVLDVRQRSEWPRGACSCLLTHRNAPSQKESARN